MSNELDYSAKNNAELFGDLIEGLVEAVTLARRGRSTWYEIKIQERERNKLVRELDLARTDLCFVKDGLRMELDVDPKDVIEEDINDLEERLYSVNRRTLDLHAVLQRQQTEIQRSLQKVHAIERRLDKDYATSKTPRLSPILWRRLRMTRAASRLQNEDTALIAHVQSMQMIAQEAIQEASSIVKVDMERLEANGRHRLDLVRALAADLLKLHRATKLFKWHAMETNVRKEVVEARRSRHRVGVAKMLLEEAAPILFVEAERLIPKDRIRLSLLEEHPLGEPKLFLNLSKELLTPGQKDELRADHINAKVRLEDCRKIFERLEGKYYKDSVEFLRTHPMATTLDFEDAHLQYERQATEQLLEAEDMYHNQRYEAMKAMVAPDSAVCFDFDWDERDEKHYFPRDAAQLRAKASRFPSKNRKAAKWLEQLPTNLNSVFRSHDEIEIENSEPALDKWNARYVDLLDQDRGTAKSLDVEDDSDEIRTRQKLLERYKAYCRDLRDELMLDGGFCNGTE